MKDLVIKFSNWYDEEFIINCEDIEYMKPISFTETYIVLKNGETYTADGKIIFE